MDGEWFTVEYREHGCWLLASQHGSLAEATKAMELQVRTMQQKVRRVVRHKVEEEG